MEYNIGDIIITKKQHPCGNNKWEIERIGVDFRFRCLQCDHKIILNREKALKIIKEKIDIK